MVDGVVVADVAVADVAAAGAAVEMVAAVVVAEAAGERVCTIFLMAGILLFTYWRYIA